MKKFKLIKEYPGSPKLGDIATQNGLDVIWFRINDSILHLVSDCENYPEFWELVVKKDYEILSFLTETGVILIPEFKGFKFFIPKDFAWDGNKHRSEKFMLKNSDTYKIHSIKRLSDGEIFTIGDLVNNKKLEKITLAIHEKNDIVLHLENLHRAVYLLKDKPLKTKQPLFTTKDGVDIFEGDKYTVVYKEYFKIPVFDNKYIINKGFKENSNYWYFSTKEKAEEYILLNKPILSLQEIYNLTDKNSGLYNESDLEKLVKNKLKIN